MGETLNSELMAIFWYQTWRQRVRDAYEKPLERAGYERAAAVAQREYVIYLAMEKWRS